MIKVGEHGTEPILELLDGIVGDWLDSGLIVIDGHSVEITLRHDVGRIEIIMVDSLGTEGNPYRV